MPLNHNWIAGGAQLFSMGALSVVNNNKLQPLTGSTTTLDNMIKTLPANQPFRKIGTGLTGGFQFSYEVVPNARTMTYGGRSISVALFQCTGSVPGRSTPSNIERAYISDEVPGRILEVDSRNFNDEGIPLGNTVLRLASAKLE